MGSPTVETDRVGTLVVAPISAGAVLLIALVLHHQLVPRLQSSTMGSSNSRTGSTTTDAQKLVEDAIRDHPVVVFSKSYCPYCVMGKNALNAAARNVDNYPGAKIFELDRMGSSGSAIQNYLARKTGRRTVPNVFVAGKSIGGGDETAKLHSRGKLADMLRNAIAAPIKVSPSVSTVEKTVEDAIAKHSVVIFSKSYCGYCRKAKAAVKEVGADARGLLRQRSSKWTKWMTVLPCRTIS